MADQKKVEKGNGKKILIIIAFLVLLAALIVCIVLLVSEPGGEQAQIPEESIGAVALERGFVEEDSADEMMEAMSEKVEEGMFECMMTATWTFEDADSVSPNAYVANVESNRYTFYFDVCLEDTDEVIYSSPMLPVGTELNEIKLEKELPAGDYNAVVMYTLVDENYEEVSSVGFAIVIHILN